MVTINKMRQVYNLIYLILLSFIGCFFWINAAYAYIDPGIGSIVFQGMLAGMVTILVFWRNLKLKIQKFFSSKDKKGNSVKKDSASNDTD